MPPSVYVDISLMLTHLKNGLGRHSGSFKPQYDVILSTIIGTISRSLKSIGALFCFSIPGFITIVYFSHMSHVYDNENTVQYLISLRFNQK